MRRSRAVDALRGAAVLLVLLHHTDFGTVLTSSKYLRPIHELQAVGYLGVSLFLVISGFSIHLRFAAGGRFTARRFLWRRWLRLHPPYYVALLFTACTYAGEHTWPRASWGLADGPMPLAVLIAVHLAVLPTTVLPPAWLSVTWSLGLEEHLYLGYAAVHRWLRRTNPMIWLLATLALCLGWRLGSQLLVPTVPKSFHPLVDESTWMGTLLFQQAPARVAEWVLGAVIAEWYLGNVRLPRLASHWTTAVASCGLTWYLVRHHLYRMSVVGHPFYLSDLLFDLVAGIAFAAVLGTCLDHEMRRPEREDSWPRLVWVGERSYSLYLVHLPVLVLSYHLINPLLDGSVARLIEVALAWPAALGGGALLFRYVEMPAARWSKRAGRQSAATLPRPREGQENANAAHTNAAHTNAAAAVGPGSVTAGAGAGAGAASRDRRGNREAAAEPELVTP